MSAVSHHHDYLFKKKQQLKVLVLLVFVVVFIIWVVWVSTGGLSRGSRLESASPFSEIVEDSSGLESEFVNFKSQLSEGWQQVQKITEAANKQQQLVEDLKNKVEASAVEIESSKLLEPDKAEQLSVQEIINEGLTE